MVKICPEKKCPLASKFKHATSASYLRTPLTEHHMALDQDQEQLEHIKFKIKDLDVIIANAQERVHLLMSAMTVWRALCLALALSPSLC